MFGEIALEDRKWTWSTEGNIQEKGDGGISTNDSEMRHTGRENAYEREVHREKTRWTWIGNDDAGDDNWIPH